MNPFSESAVEDTALAWLKRLGWTVKHGSNIAPGEMAGERLCTEIGLSGYAVLTRPTMLPKLISGELRVKDAGRFIGGIV